MRWFAALATSAALSCSPSPDSPTPTGATAQTATSAPSATREPTAANDPAAPRGATAAADARQARTVQVLAPSPDDRALPAGPVAYGLLLPRGSQRVASNSLGDDYIVPFELEAVLAHVRVQLETIRFEPNGTGGGRFLRVTPRGQPASRKLHLLVMPYPGRGTLVRVLELPSEEPSDSQRLDDVRRFEAEQGRLD